MGAGLGIVPFKRNLAANHLRGHQRTICDMLTKKLELLADERVCIGDKSNSFYQKFSYYLLVGTMSLRGVAVTK